MACKLIILPHAGGASHAYQGLARSLYEGAPLFFHDFPGHGRRSNEPLLNTMDELVEDVMALAGAAGFFDKDWAIFGHSMGALVAHAVIEKRIRKGLSRPTVFFASGARPPSWSPAPIADSVNGTAGPKRISSLPSDLFWFRMAGYGGIPKELSENSSILEYFENLLRMDFSIIEHHTPDTAPIDVPTHVFYGNRDHRVVACLDEWATMSVSPPHFHPFDGNHFFVLDHLSRIGEIIGQALAGTGKPSNIFIQEHVFPG